MAGTVGLTGAALIVPPLMIGRAGAAGSLLGDTGAAAVTDAMSASAASGFTLTGAGLAGRFASNSDAGRLVDGAVGVVDGVSVEAAGRWPNGSGRLSVAAAGVGGLAPKTDGRAALTGDPPNGDGLPAADDPEGRGAALSTSSRSTYSGSSSTLASSAMSSSRAVAGRPNGEAAPGLGAGRGIAEAELPNSEPEVGLAGRGAKVPALFGLTDDPSESGALVGACPSLTGVPSAGALLLVMLAAPLIGGVGRDPKGLPAGRLPAEADAGVNTGGVPIGALLLNGLAGRGDLSASSGSD